MFHKLLALLTIALLIFGGTAAQEENDLPDANPALVEANNAFAFAFYNRLDRPDEANILFSPYSISQAFAMAYAGAEGETAQQIAAAMHFSLSQDELHPAFADLNTNLTQREYDMPDGEGVGFTLNVANAIWGLNYFPWRGEYVDLVDTYYTEGFRRIDFMADPESARNQINDWVEDQTEERIKDIVPPGAITRETLMVIANAIYFNASWLRPFNERQTQDESFTTLEGEQVTVPMMRQTETFLYAEGDDYQALELPYFGNDTAMLVILPEAGRFSDVEDRLDTDLLNEITDALSGNRVEVYLPGFEYEFRLSLTSTLREMGMTDAFDDGRADFTGMIGETAEQTLFISDALHKAFIKVDEAGTEAAAATVLIMQATGGAITQPIEFRADRPFIFAIRDRVTGSVLFLGRVVSPAA